MELDGNTALLTGATGGLGRSIAAELAARGADLVLSSRQATELDRLAEKLPGTGHRTVVADLAGEGAASELVAAADPFQILIANAGVGGGTAIADNDAAAISRVSRLNLEVPAVMAAAALARMVPAGRGHIVFVSSLAGKAIPSGSALYAATKSGLRALGMGLRKDLGDSGVGISIVYPGFVRDAGMFADSGAKPPPGIGTASPEEVAEAVADAIERDRAQFDVAPVPQRGLANLAHHLPAVVSRLERAIGTEDLSKQISKSSAERARGGG